MTNRCHPLDVFTEEGFQIFAESTDAVSFVVQQNMHRILYWSDGMLTLQNKCYFEFIVSTNTETIMYGFVYFVPLRTENSQKN